MRKRKQFLVLILIAILFNIAIISIIGRSTTSAAFIKSGKSEVSISAGSFSDKFIVKIFNTNNEEVSENDLELDMDYVIKIYNTSPYKCSFYLTAEESELNSFSKYLVFYLSEDKNKNMEKADSSIVSSSRLTSKSKLIDTKNFLTNEEPLIYNFKISTDILKTVIKKAPQNVTDFNFGLKLKFVAETVSN